LIGVVSGMNEKGLTVTLNASKSTIPWQAATPVTLLAREILQYASTIAEAYDIARKRDLFVSESIMIGSARDHKTAIIEKSPELTSLFNAAGDRIICSNHFQSAEFANDEVNKENIRESDSYDRYRRVDELLERYGSLNVNDMVSVLRDQKVLGDSDAGTGNKLAINQLIAHHSVVFKPDSLLAWVSASPWQLGKYVAYDLNEIFDLKTEDIHTQHEIYSLARNIPADTFLISEDFKQFIKYREMSRQISLAIKNDRILPEGFADEYIITNPRLYLTYSNLGEYFQKTRDFEKAYGYYKMALNCKLPGLYESQRLKEITEKLLKKMNHGHS
jgi:tetratricopeptide (TPR) repeat protein